MTWVNAEWGWVLCRAQEPAQWPPREVHDAEQGSSSNREVPGQADQDRLPSPLNLEFPDFSDILGTVCIPTSLPGFCDHCFTSRIHIRARSALLSLNMQRCNL